MKFASFKHVFAVLTAIVCLLLETAPVLAAFTAPAYSGFVNDYSGLLSAQERASLEQSLSEYEKQTSTEIAIVITNDFQGLDAFNYSQKLFDAWKVGKEGKNNGIVIAIGPKEGLPFPERGDIFINNGKGIEGALPDSVTGRIIRDEMIPSFKVGDFYEALTKGVLAIQQALKGEYTAESSNIPIDVAMDFFWFIFIAFTFFSSYFVSYVARSKSWYAGGIIGGVGGFLIAYIGLALTYAFIAGAVFALIGFILDYFLSKTYQERLAKGLPTDFWNTRGGFWGGGRGGFGGGGFGGFGGGHSGGGGAGGGW